MHFCNTAVFCHILPQTRDLQLPALALLWMSCGGTCYVGSWRVSLQNLGIRGTVVEECALFTHPWWVCRSESHQWVTLSAGSNIRCRRQCNARVSGHLCISLLLAPCLWLIARDISSHQLGSLCHQLLLVSTEVPWIQLASSRDLSQPEE